MRASLVLPEKDLEIEEIDWFTLDVLRFAEAERQREKIRRGALDVATRHPHVTFRTLLDTVAGAARLNRRYLRSTFGYDVRRHRWLRRRRVPESEHDWERLWSSKRFWDKQIMLVGAIMSGAIDAHARGEDPYLSGVRQFFSADHMEVWPDGCDVMIAPWTGVRVVALTRYAGTLLARINLARNHRLRAVLAPGRPFEQRLDLAKRLPGAVVAALSEGGPHEHPQTVLNRAVRLLEYEGRPRRPYRPRKNNLDGEPTPWPDVPWRYRYDPLPLIVRWTVKGQHPSITDQALRESGLGSLEDNLRRLTPEKLRSILDELGVSSTDFQFPAFEQFEARESAANWMTGHEIDDEVFDAATELAARHGLSQSEAVVFALKGANFKHREIGEMLGIAVGTSKALLHRATQKLVRTA